MVRREIAGEMIKPCSPTPPQLRKLQLSFLDQLAPPTYIHIILYFQPSIHHHDPDETSRKLKRSFSDALAIYYPLAGRIRENSWVDCNDAGAEYAEARFNDVRILDVVENPQMEELKRYVPVTPPGGGDIPLAVQVSFFGCSGTAIGVCMSHRVADAMSMAMFINIWAAFSRGDEKTIAAAKPSFSLASPFIPADLSGFLPVAMPPEKIMTKRFTFDDQKVAAVKKAASGPLMENPTRVEAVSAFIWQHFIEATTMKTPMNRENRLFAATHAVDIRSRSNPSLPHQFFGNACARAMAMTTESGNKKRDYCNLAMKLRDIIQKADADYVKRLENGDAFLKYYSVNEENDPAFNDGRKSLEFCGFTSWCRLPAYDADYGWGKPVWVSIVGVPQKNLIFLLGTKSGDGIEAWVNMVEEDIAMIESSYHLLHHQEDTIKHS